MIRRVQHTGTALRAASVALALVALAACRPRPEPLPLPGVTTAGPVATVAPEPSARTASSAPDASSAAAPAPASSSAPAAIVAGTPVVPTARIALFEVTGAPPDADDPLNWGVAIDGIPAVTDDGSFILSVDPGDDLRSAEGQRAFLVALDVSHDRVANKMSLLTPAEARALTAASPAAASAANKRAEVAAAGKRRLADMQSWLAARHWVHMAELRVDDSLAAEPPTVKYRDGAHGMTVDFDGKRVTAHDAAGAVVFDRAVPSWTLPTSRPDPRSSVVCTFRPDVTGVAVEPTRLAMLVTVAQQEIGGGDFCNLNATLHAMRLRAARP